MIIGVPSEVKNNEFRVGLTPDSVKILTKAQLSFEEGESGCIFATFHFVSFSCWYLSAYPSAGRFEITRV